ncbi:carbohydrate-binding protein [Paenibacillus roseipurpureus]|uniref:Carbohydrate-binding protein n=1 Tax=Paenibacillus roseopurpureus TaxID=2918901 RepID=A0AA96LSY2_9BACL|nr:carbohydrate-binding protein [Paenibacillus sp. MBLB1832]WNR45956.1 carbohydrate-binding protein [Paenibacillus sp. MBLB1832]
MKRYNRLRFTFVFAWLAIITLVAQSFLYLNPVSASGTIIQTTPGSITFNTPADIAARNNKVNNAGTPVNGVYPKVYTYNTGWIKFSSVNFDNRYTKFAATFGAALNDGALLRVRLDSTTGTEIGNLTVKASTAWTKSISSLAPLADVTGVHDVFISFESTTAGLTGSIDLYGITFYQSNTVSLTFPQQVFDQQGTVANGTYSSISDNSWVRFKDVDLGNGVAGLSANYSAPAGSGAKVSVYLDSLTGGTLLTEFETKTTTAGSTFEHPIQQIAKGGYKGVHDVFIRFSANSAGQAAADFYSLTFYRDTTISLDARADLGASPVSGTDYSGVSLSSTKVYSNNGAWVRYAAVNFDEGFTSVVAKYASPTGYGAKVTLKLDDRTNGPTIASFETKTTVSWTAEWGDSIPLTQAVYGVHDLYVLFSANAAGKANADFYTVNLVGSNIGNGATIVSVQNTNGTANTATVTQFANNGTYALPATTVTATMSDGTTRSYSMSWQPQVLDTLTAGVKTAIGTIAGTDYSTLFTLTVNPAVGDGIVRNITIDPTRIVKNLPFNPIGINIDHYLDSDIYNPSRARPLTEALQELGVKSLRYAEGDSGDSYLWTQAPYPTVPNAPLSPKSLVFNPSAFPFNQATNYNSDGTLKNIMDVNEFFQITKTIGAEPFYIVGIDAGVFTTPANGYNLGMAKAKEAAVELVKYAKLNNRPIKYFEIGNETDLKNDSQGIAKWDPVQYANVVVEFSQALKAVDPNIKIGLSGGLSNWTAWLGAALPICVNDIDFIVAHQYIQNWVWVPRDPNNPSKDSILTAMDSLVAQGKITVADRQRIKLEVTEFSSYTPNTPKANDMSAALNNFEKIYNLMEIREVEYMHLWITRWFGDSATNLRDMIAIGPNNEILPMGRSLQVWATTLKDQLVYSDHSKYTDVNDVKAYSTYSPDSKEMTVYLVNKFNNTNEVELTFNNYLPDASNEKWVWKGTYLGDKNPTWGPAGTVPVVDGKIRLTLDRASVTVLKLKASSSKDITSFTVPYQMGSSVIDVTNHTVSFKVPLGTNVLAMMPSVTTSAYATVTPGPGVAVDFTSPVSYTVQAEDGSTQLWTVTATPSAMSDIMTGPNSVNGGASFTVKYGVANVTQSVYSNVYAQQLLLTYDPTVLEFTGATSLKSGYTIAALNTSTPGQINFLLASLGSSGAITADGDLVQLNWKAKSVVQSASAVIKSSSILADGLGREMLSFTSTLPVQVIFVDKSALAAELQTALSLYNGSTEGNVNGQYASGSRLGLMSAIQSAQAVFNNPESSKSQVEAAVTSLQTAVQTFQYAVVTVDRTLLGNTLASAQAAYNSAVEGILIGQYPIGSKATLQQAIAAASAVWNTAAVSQQQLTEAAVTLNQAQNAFAAKVNVRKRTDVNGDSRTGIGDLALVSANYGITSVSPGWEGIKLCDVNGDSVIDIVDLSLVASSIVQ